MRMVVHLASIVFLTTMAGFWLGLGQSLIRFPVAILGSLVIGIIFSFVIGSENSILCSLFCLTITAVTGFSAFVIRFVSGELLQTGAVEQIDESLQFGIKHILIWTTVIAVLTAFFQFLSPESPDLQNLQLVVLLTLTYSITAVVQIWSLLGVKIDRMRIAIWCFFVAGSVGVVFVFFWDELKIWTIVTIFSQFLIAGALYSLRMQDYRFVPRLAK